MKLQDRVEIMIRLGAFLKGNDASWMAAKQKAAAVNPWFTEAFIDHACTNIVEQFLQPGKLREWIDFYHLDDNIHPKTVGLVMAGNIPLVGFHDFLCVFIAGHRQKIKLSSKDEILFKEILRFLQVTFPATKEWITIADQLKGCDAYIATGSNNSSRYFEQYFAKYPHIIRKNRTSVAVLSGEEKAEDLEALADDVHLYYGLGCRNITKIYVPEGYDFSKLLQAFEKYAYFNESQRYKNNFDYQLSIILLNRQPYMTNGTTLLIESSSPHSPISVLHYSFYKPGETVPKESVDELQCVAGPRNAVQGTLQTPFLFDYADGVDTMEFLLSI
jgi:hypothetical protein